MSDARDNYTDISKLTERLIQSFSMDEQQQLFSQFLEFPVIPDGIRHKYPDPFLYIDIDHIKVSEKLQIDNEIIENQLNADFNREKPGGPEFSASVRKKYITRFAVLWRYGLLDDKQNKLFADLLWAKRGPNGFPANTDYNDFAFMWFPHPDDLNTDELFKQYINQTEISFGEYSMTTNGTPLTGGHSSYFRNIIGTYNVNLSYQWRSEDLNCLIGKIINWPSAIPNAKSIMR